MTPDVSAPTDPGRHLTLLIVDDSAMMRAMLKRAVLATGVPVHDVLEAADGSQGLAVLQQQQVDVLFTDVNMPVMTGIELLRAVAGNARWDRLVRVIISTDGSEARRAEATSLKVSRYVEKPFRPETMRDVLSELSSAHV